MNQTQFDELIELYALDLLDATEQQQAEAYLVTSPAARAKLAELRETASTLAFSVEPVAPAAGLRPRLMAEISRAGSKLQTVPIVTAKPTGSPLPDARPLESNIRAFERPLAQTPNPKPQTPTGSRWLGLAAGLAVVALGGGWWFTWERAQILQSQLTTTHSELIKETVELQKAREKAAWLASPEARNAALGGTTVSPEARAKLTFDPQTGQALLTVSNLPPTPSGKAYQLWFIADGKPIPGLVFMIDKKGRLELMETIPASGRAASVFAVTLEPAGGVSAPTGDMFLKSSS